MTSKQHFHGNFSWNSSPYSYCWGRAKQTHTYSKTKNIAIFFLFNELHIFWMALVHVLLFNLQIHRPTFQFQWTITRAIMYNSIIVKQNILNWLLQEKLCQFFPICHPKCCTLNMSMYNIQVKWILSLPWCCKSGTLCSNGNVTASNQLSTSSCC